MTIHRDPADLKRIGTGLALIVFPMVWVFAFAVHPHLLSPHLLGPEDLIRRARGNGLLQFGHVLVTLNTALLVVITVHFIRLLDRTRAARVGLLGASLAVVGACLPAADKGAMCLTLSAIDTLPLLDVDQMMPGLVAIFSFRGWVAIVWGIVLGPLGVLIQTMGMWRVKVLPGWQLGLLTLGLLFVGFPDGAEIINLTAALALSAALVPLGLSVVRGVRAARAE